MCDGCRTPTFRVVGLRTPYFIFLATPDGADQPACGGGPSDFFLYATPVAESQGLGSQSASAHSRCTSPGRRLPGERLGARRPADRSPGSLVEVGTSWCAESVHRDASPGTCRLAGTSRGKLRGGVHHPCPHFGDANRIAAGGAPPTSWPADPTDFPWGRCNTPSGPFGVAKKDEIGVRSPTTKVGRPLGRVGLPACPGATLRWGCTRPCPSFGDATLLEDRGAPTTTPWPKIFQVRGPRFGIRGPGPWVVGVRTPLFIFLAIPTRVSPTSVG